MDSFVGAVAPAFACGLALQRAMEILDPLIELVGSRKKLVVGWVAFFIGLAFAGIGQLRVLNRLGVTDKDALDFIVTALIVSAGTEGFNSLLKFLGYAKEAKKDTAAVQVATPAQQQAIERQVG